MFSENNSFMKPHSVAVVVTTICFLFLWVGKLHETGLKWRAGGETVSKVASCPPYIGVFDLFFTITLSGRVQQLLCAMVVVIFF